MSIKNYFVTNFVADCQYLLISWHSTLLKYDRHMCLKGIRFPGLSVLYDDYFAVLDYIFIFSRFDCEVSSDAFT